MRRVLIRMAVHNTVSEYLDFIAYTNEFKCYFIEYLRMLMNFNSCSAKNIKNKHSIKKIKGTIIDIYSENY